MITEESVLKANVGNIDRALRIFIGLILIGLTVTGHVGLWGWLGIVPLLTGIVRICPLYSVLGVKTCSASKTDAK
ncbi:YgaP family membrane protein [Burkholderia vietnamiensis]|uniref:YgaP family membrane protein n=1 Tax=Burkholderia vietnamiensis TaxID=60552 RepID=UPI003F510232